MGKCAYCSAKERLPFRCKFCGEQFCGKHRLPENHSCIGLEKFKEESRKEPEKWIYEPFKTRSRTSVRMGIKKPVPDRLLQLLRGIDARKILYLILAYIFITTLYKAIL